MNRKIISALLALVLCFSFALSVSAEPKAIDFVVDECGYLADGELEALNNLASSICEETGVGIFYVFTTAETMEDYDIAGLTGGMEDYFIMMENDTHWTTFAGGMGKTIDTAKEDALRDVYDAADTYVGGVEDFLNAAAECFPSIADTPQGDILEVEEYLVYDDADLLTDSEESSLTKRLLSISHTYNAQIVVATIASMDGGDVDGFLEYFYDSMGFGYGENHDGVLLLVCMDPREYRILSNGYAGTAIDTDSIEVIGNTIKTDLSDGNYAEAFQGFADECEYYLDGYLNGFPFEFGMTLLISLVIGIVAGLIVAFILKGQLKSVRKQDKANVYVKPGSMEVTVSNDFYLYRNVTRTKKESNSSSGSGSSSGSSRSTGGGSF